MENIGKELVDRFALNYSGDALIDYEYAKQCALICVDEILRGIKPKNDDERFVFELGGNQYHWREVKQEIEKL